MWDVDTGSKIMQFSQAHGEAEITAMSFDPSGRRLITGGRDGTIKIWNFNNGACLSVLHNEDTAEVRYVAVVIVGRGIVGRCGCNGEGRGWCRTSGGDTH